jgi:hypothetical protein
VLKGKYGYMSPEQVRGISVDHRSDLFAVGVVFWELLTRERLFPGGSDFSVLEKVRHGEVYPPTLVMPKIDAEVERIVMRALARDPEDRFASASDLHDAVVSVMLRRFGQPSARELGALMQSLFAAEQQESQRLLEEARRFDHMPEDAPPLASAAAAPPAEDAPPPPSPPPSPARRLPEASTAPGSRLARPPAVVRTGESAVARAVTKRMKTPTAPTRGISRRRVTEDTPVTGPPEAMAGPEASAGAATTPSPPPAAVIAFGKAIPTEVRRAFQRRPALRDLSIVLAALLIAILTIGITWWGTRPTPGPVRGSVVVISVPEGAQVLVDDVLVGETPFSSSTLSSGPHTLVLRKEGWLSQTRELEVVPHRVIEIRVDLQPAH